MVLRAGTFTHRKSDAVSVRGSCVRPVGFLLFEVQDGSLDLLRQLVTVAPGPTRTVRQSFQTGFLIAVKDLRAGLARDRELSTQSRHFLPVQQARHKANTFIHNRTLLPRHHSLP
jgi:hypothetical protein